MIETSTELPWKSSVIFGYLACIVGLSKKVTKGTKLRANAQNKEQGEGVR